MAVLDLEDCSAVDTLGSEPEELIVSGNTEGFGSDIEVAVNFDAFVVVVVLGRFVLREKSEAGRGGKLSMKIERHSNWRPGKQQ
jgi:hypothetical protein